MDSWKLNIGVMGATGAVGREIVNLLAERETLTLGEVHFVASAACTTDRVEFRDRHIRVLDPDSDAFAADDVLFVAVPRKVARTLVPRLRKARMPVIDVTGVAIATAGVPRVVSWLNRDALRVFPDTRAAACPGPAVVALATLLGPLRAQGGRIRVRGTLLHAASTRGRAGVEELSGQVVALFNSRTPPRKVFPSGLAFDVLPSLGPAQEDGWSIAEDDVAEELAAFLDADPTDFSLTSLVAPWFTGLGLSLHVVPEHPLDLAAVESALAGAPGVKLDASTSPDAMPHVSQTREDTLLHVGRLRADRRDEGFHVWAVADEIRFGVAANAVGILEHLLADGLLTRRDG